MRALHLLHCKKLLEDLLEDSSHDGKARGLASKTDRAINLKYRNGAG
jgi:hypothetical protein